MTRKEFIGATFAAVACSALPSISTFAAEATGRALARRLPARTTKTRRI
jgi:hypothetical protein